jgi:hypothetical protein
MMDKWSNPESIALSLFRQQATVLPVHFHYFAQQEPCSPGSAVRLHLSLLCSGIFGSFFPHRYFIRDLLV